MSKDEPCCARCDQRTEQWCYHRDASCLHARVTKYANSEIHGVGATRPEWCPVLPKSKEPDRAEWQSKEPYHPFLTVLSADPCLKVIRVCTDPDWTVVVEKDPSDFERSKINAAVSDEKGRC